METPLDKLRARLGERILDGGTEDDTMFGNAELLDVLASAGTFDEALLEAWHRKAAMLSTLVDTSEGTSKRAMSDLHGQALAQIKSLTSAGVGSETGGGTRVHLPGRRGPLP